MQPPSSVFVPFLLLAVLVPACTGPRPLHGGKALTTPSLAGGLAQTLTQSDNPAQASRQTQHTIRTRTYPIETVTKFETKSTESEGWVEQPVPPHLIRHSCVISVSSPFSSSFRTPHSALRITYSGGYVLPGTTPAPGQTPLPPDLENACVEQVAFGFINREKQGLKTNWPKADVYQQFATQDLLESVASVLKRYARWTL